MTDISHIVGCSLSVPQHSSLYILHLLVQLVLGRKLMTSWICRVSKLGCSFNVFANKQRSFTCMFVPPGDQGFIISSLMSDFPIQLRNAVVYPTIIHPQKYIGIKVIKILQTIRFRTIRIISFIAINTERRNTEFYPRFNMMDGLP